MAFRGSYLKKEYGLLKIPQWAIQLSRLWDTPPWRKDPPQTKHVPTQSIPQIRFTQIQKLLHGSETSLVTKGLSIEEAFAKNFDADYFLQKIRGHQQRWKAFYQGHSGVRHGEKVKSIEAHFPRDYWRESKSLGKLSRNDINLLYQLSLISQFLWKQEGIQYQSGAKLAQVFSNSSSQRFGDCNDFTTLASDLARRIGIDHQLRVQFMPGHVTLLVKLDNDQELYFDYANKFLPVDFYRSRIDQEPPQALEKVLATFWSNAGSNFLIQAAQSNDSSLFNRAIFYLDRSSDLIPGQSMLYYNLAAFFLVRREPQKAKRALKKSLALNNKYRPAAKLLAQGNFTAQN